ARRARAPAAAPVPVPAGDSERERLRRARARQLLANGLLHDHGLNDAFDLGSARVALLLAALLLRGERLTHFEVIGVNGAGLQPEPPRLDVDVLDILDRDV